jgi:hypothetical protein
MQVTGLLALIRRLRSDIKNPCTDWREHAFIELWSLDRPIGMHGCTAAWLPVVLSPAILFSLFTAMQSRTRQSSHSLSDGPDAGVADLVELFGPDAREAIERFARENGGADGHFHRLGA